MIGKETHIVLIGFMGSGKSTIGKLLAKYMHRTFVDMDVEIENIQGKSIKWIFENNGSDFFRDLEQKVLLDLLNRKNKLIIASGGGVPCFNENMETISNNSYSIYLKVGVQELYRRLSNDRSRPLLKNKSKKELYLYIENTLRVRNHFYRTADRVVRGIDSPNEIVERIYKTLKTEIE